MQLAILETQDALFAVRDEWRALLARSDTGNQATRSPLWLEAWWRHYGQDGGRALCVATWRSSGRLVAIAPMLRRRVRWRELLGFDRVEALGSGERADEETCSDYLGLVAERGFEADAADAFAEAAAHGTLGPCDEIVIPQMAASASEDPGVKFLSDAFARLRWDVELTPTPSAPYVPLPASFDAYLRLLDRDQRYKARRALAEFDKWTSGRHVVHVARSEAERAHAFEVLCRLHGERWQQEGKPGVFASPRFAAFHTDVTRSLLAEGALDLAWIEVAGEAVSATYSIVWNGKMQFYQSGRKLDVPKQVKPGIVANLYGIQRAITAGLGEYDFLAGATRYKLDLTTAQRPLVTLRATRTNLRGRARSLAERGLEVARRLRSSSASSGMFRVVSGA
jgi:CelD/BcsL family acetyltransferase involved in cellulose biosynthesis